MCWTFLLNFDQRMHGKFDAMEISTILTHGGNYNGASLEIDWHISAVS